MMDGWAKGLPREICGIHDPHNRSLYGDHKGWVLKVVAIGQDPNDTNSIDLSEWEAAGFGTICRIQYGWGDMGTIPLPQNDEPFLKRLRNFVAHSRGCHIWILGNEMNHEQERPNGQLVLPDRYADLYVKAWNVLHSTAGHEEDWLIVGAVAPYNATTTYTANPKGDWVFYFVDILEQIAGRMGIVDAIALHTYTHGSEPQLVRESRKMDPPFETREYNFLAFLDFMHAIPGWCQHVPVFITETDQDQAWENVNHGWVKNAYAMINAWNTVHEQQIYCLLLYCWDKRGGPTDYRISEKANVLLDFIEAVDMNYQRVVKGGPTMRVVYKTSFEEGFYRWEGQAEVTCPNGWEPVWDKKYGVRPEYKPKDKQAGEPEVLDGRYAAGFFHIDSKWDGALERTFTLSPEVDVEATVRCMCVTNKSGSAGVNLQAIADGTVIDGDWVATHDAEFEQRKWYTLTVKARTGTDGQVTIRLHGRTNDPVAWHTHWDLFVLEAADGEPPIPPPPGPGIGVINEIQGHLAKAIEEISIAYEQVGLLDTLAEPCIPLSRVFE